MIFLLLSYPTFLDSSVNSIKESPYIFREIVNSHVQTIQKSSIKNPVLGVIIEKEESKNYIGIGDGWCTDLIREYREIPWYGDALYWKQNAINANYIVGDVPKLNAIMVENKLPYGHVALVVEIMNDSFTVMEQNFVERNVISERTLPLNYDCEGFIY